MRKSLKSLFLFKYTIFLTIVFGYGCQTLAIHSKSDALKVASKKLKCNKKKLKYKRIKGGNLLSSGNVYFYDVQGCKKTVCIRCKDKCKVTKDPRGLVCPVNHKNTQ